MLDIKIITTIIGLIIAVSAVGAIKSKEEQENFPGSGVSGTWRLDRVVAKNPQEAKKGMFFSVPGTYSSILSPRFGNVNYGSNINYNMPSYENQAVPRNPLTFSSLAGPQNASVSQTGRNMKENYSNRMSNNSLLTRHNPSVKEGYCACQSCSGSCSGVPRCGTGGVPEYTYKGGAPIQEANYGNGNYNQVLENTYSQGQKEVSQLPVDDMSSFGGDIEQAPVVYDRLVYANRSSRLRGRGDPIRGDLAIVPSNAEWFRPSVAPNIDLQQGALSVLAGLENSQGQQLAKMVYASSGGADTSIAGVNMSHQDFNNVNMSNLYSGDLSVNQHDINVSAFP